MRVRIIWGEGEAIATLNNTATALLVVEALPLQSRVSTWGKEIYFKIPVRAGLEPDARQVVEPGTVCFWVEGQSLAIPFGPTPVSQGSECRLVTKVNILGRLEEDASTLETVREGETIRVEKIGHS